MTCQFPNATNELIEAIGKELFRKRHPSLYWDGMPEHTRQRYRGEAITALHTLNDFCGGNLAEIVEKIRAKHPSAGLADVGYVLSDEEAAALVSIVRIAASV